MRINLKYLNLGIILVDIAHSSNSSKDIANANVNLAIGLSCFLTPNGALRTNIGQLFVDYTSENLVAGNNEYTAYGFDLNLNDFNIGVQYYINR